MIIRRYLLEASDATVGTLEPVTITEPASHTHFLDVLESARECEVPESLLPICEDNSDFFCVAEPGKVFFWPHNGSTEENWPDLASWIEDVWLNAA